MRRLNMPFATLTVATLSIAAAALDNGLALTPPMGWSAWNVYHCSPGPNEGNIKGNARALVESGMRDCGYTVVKIDDCWGLKDRNPDGSLKANPSRFPKGMKEMGDYLHSLGLKFGIYTCKGDKTCASWNPDNDYMAALGGYEEVIANQFASWGVDYVKLDGCGASPDGVSREDVARKFSQALINTGRPIILSLSFWTYSPYMPEVAHLWRTTGDLRAQWDGGDGTGAFNGLITVIDKHESRQGRNDFSGPGAWNDPDMLVVGRGLSYGEDKAHFSIWCVYAAPLLAGNDLTTMSAQTLEILTNKEAIAVNQDSLGHQGYRVVDNGDREVFAKKMKDGSRAVVLFNRTSSATSISVSWDDVWLPSGQKCVVRDLWKHEDVGMETDSYSATVPSHGVVMVRLYPEGSVRAAHSRLLKNTPAMRVYHDQQAGTVSVFHRGSLRSVALTNLRGGAVCHKEVDGQYGTVSTAELSKGIYLLNTVTRDGSHIASKISVK